MDDELAAILVSNLSDDLRKPEYRGHPNELFGHCYVASEAYYYTKGGEQSGLQVMRVKHEGATHWFLRSVVDCWAGEFVFEYIDLTAGQFDTPPPYEDAVATGFLTKGPSKRARVLLERSKGKIKKLNNRREIKVAPDG